MSWSCMSVYLLQQGIYRLHPLTYWQLEVLLWSPALLVYLYLLEPTVQPHSNITKY